MRRLQRPLQWFFYLIFILFIHSAPIFADEELAVELQPASAPQRTVPAKGFFTSTFTIINMGKKQDSYILEAMVPEGWQIISSFHSMRLLPNESRIIPLTIFVPSNALTTNVYQVSLTATSELNPQVSAKAQVTVQVLPRANVKVIRPSKEARLGPGESIGYNFTIINLGNGKDRFKITPSSAHGERVEVSKEIVDLEMGEQIEVKAIVRIPLDVSSGTRHCLTLRASSVLLEPGVSDETIVYTLITERKQKIEKDIYKTLPAQIMTYLSGLGTGKPLGPQAEFHTSGNITDMYWVNFAYQGPYFKNRQNYRGFTKERISLDLGSSLWDIGLGDTTVNISELTAISLYEKGGRFHIQKNPVSLSVFELEKKQPSFTEKLSGGKIITKIGRNNEIGLNFFQANEDKTDLTASRAAEKKKIVSISALHRSEDFLFQGECAKSRFNNGSSEKHDKAWWINYKLKRKRLYIDSEYIKAGSDYPGRRKDYDGYRAYLSLGLFKPLWTWFHRLRSHNNLKGDPSKTTDTLDRVEFGGSLTTKELPFFSVSYQINNTKSARQTPLADTQEKGIVFRSYKSHGNLSISFDSKWTKSEDGIVSTNSRISEYTTRVYERWQKLSGWVGYTYNLEKNISEGSKTQLARKELGLTYHPLSMLICSISFTQEDVKGEKGTDTLSLDISYEPWSETYFFVEGEMRTDHREFNNDWQLWIAFRKNFDLPLFFIKTKGSVKGVVFIDENNNGIMDERDAGVFEMKLIIEETHVTTNKEGGFRFPSVIPGEVELDMDYSTLPVDLAPRIQLPFEFNLRKGEIKEIDIPLVRTCKVKGGVFEDENKNGIRDENEKGLSLIRIILADDSSIYKETFSDNNGRYSFTGLLPGRYEVRIDEAWLPERYKMTTASTYSTDLKPAQEIDNLNFGAVEKERPVIKTFSTTGEETINLKNFD